MRYCSTVLAVSQTCVIMFLMFIFKTKKRIYLDYAAATPVRKEVLQAMMPFFSVDFGNGGAIHQEGVTAYAAITKSRVLLATMLHIRPQGITFTGSGTESNNLALFGCIEARRKAGIAYSDMEVITTALEHPSVSEVLTQLQRQGVVVRFAEVDSDGRIALSHFQTLLSPKTVLVTCAYVQSEIGVIQAIKKIARIVREQPYGNTIHIHVDAAQAPLWLPCALDQLGADSLTLDAGKCYGPKGVGVLAFRHGVQFAPHIFGGGQEYGLRSGTENTALIIGAVTSLSIAIKNHAARRQAVGMLRDIFLKDLTTIDGCVLNGSLEHRVANNINISIAGIDSEFAVICLDEAGIACATKSACAGAKGDGSEVVRILTRDNARALSTIRFTLGEETTEAELKRTAKVLADHVAWIRGVNFNSMEHAPLKKID